MTKKNRRCEKCTKEKNFGKCNDFNCSNYFETNYIDEIIEKRIWVFVASKGDVPYFSQLFDDHTEMKEFSAKHSAKDKCEKYSSTYFDLTDKNFIKYSLQQIQDKTLEACEDAGRNMYLKGKEDAKKEIKDKIENAKTVKSEMEEMEGKDFSDGYQYALEDILLNN